MTLIALVDLRLARSLPDLFSVKFALKYPEKQRSVIIAINFFANVALKTGFN